MLKRVFILFMVIGAFSILPSLAHAGPAPIFGPQTFERTTGKPDTYTATIEACNTGAVYNLVVENGEGGKGGKDRVSSASITLNGEVLLKQKDFNQRVDRLERAVTLLPENTLDVKLASGPRGFITVSINCVANCLGVEVIAPDDDSTINKSNAIIRGRISNVYGETGVTITNEGSYGALRGLAEVQGTDFAGITPLQPGANTITTTATDVCGYQAQDTLTVNAEPAEEPVRLTAIPSSGVPSITTGTLEVTFTADTFLEVSNYSWDFDGDGTPDWEGGDLAGVAANYENPGLYFPKVTVTDSEGNTYTETALVNVLSIEEMNAVLKGKWDGMKRGLVIGDSDGVLKYFSSDSQEKYSEAFDILKDQLESIFGKSEELRFISISDNVAKYENIVLEDNGKRYSYQVIFIQDENGIWKIMQF